MRLTYLLILLIPLLLPVTYCAPQVVSVTAVSGNLTVTEFYEDGRGNRVMLKFGTLKNAIFNYTLIPFSPYNFSSELHIVCYNGSFTTEYANRFEATGFSFSGQVAFDELAKSARRVFYVVNAQGFGKAVWGYSYVDGYYFKMILEEMFKIKATLSKATITIAKVVGRPTCGNLTAPVP